MESEWEQRVIQIFRSQVLLTMSHLCPDMPRTADHLCHEQLQSRQEARSWSSPIRRLTGFRRNMMKNCEGLYRQDSEGEESALLCHI